MSTILKSKIVKTYLPSFISYALLTLAFPPFHYSWLAFIALVPWIIQLKTIRTPQALKTGAFFGTLFTLTQMAWVKSLITTYIGDPIAGYVAWFVVAVLCIIFFYLPLSFCLRKCMKHNRLELIPLVWVSFELIRSYFPIIGFPWGLLATPLSLKPYLIQHASIGTVYMVSAWVAFVNILVVMLFIKTSTRRFAISGIIVTSCLIFSLIRYYDVRSPIAVIKVALAQIGVDFAFTKQPEKSYKIKTATRNLLKEAYEANPDLIVFPEAMCFGLEYAQKNFFGKHPKYPILFGAHREGDEQKVHQSIFLYDGKEWKLADKIKLVAFGEYIPFRKQLKLPEDFIMRDMTPGDKMTTFQFQNDIKIGTLICFESNFPDLASTHTSQDATLLVNTVIDDWYVGTAAPEQLFYACIWRSVECGLPLLRVGPLGISGIIDSRGNIQIKNDDTSSKLIVSNIALPTRSDSNPYRAWLPWLFILSIPYAIIEDIIKFIKRRREQLASS